MGSSPGFKSTAEELGKLDHAGSNSAFRFHAKRANWMAADATIARVKLKCTHSPIYLVIRGIRHECEQKKSMPPLAQHGEAEKKA